MAQVLAANELYDKMWVYYNLFQPVMHLMEKEVTLEDGKPARVKRRYDQARTPFDRLCATDAILPEHREQLEALRDRINPRRLRQEIYDAIDHIFTLPGVVPGITEDVHQTLAKNLNPKKGADSPVTLSFDLTRSMTPLKKGLRPTLDGRTRAKKHHFWGADPRNRRF